MSAAASGALCASGVVTVATIANLMFERHRRSGARKRLRHESSGGIEWRQSAKAGAGVVVLAVVIVTPKVSLVLIPALTVVLIVVRRALASRRRSEYDRDLPHVLDGVARSMRSGANLTHALRDVTEDQDGPVAADLAVVAKQADLGRPLSECLDEWAASRPVPAVRLTTASLKLAIRTGAAHAEVVDRVSMGVRRSLAASTLARTHATQARASALALTLLPVGVTGISLAVNPATRAFLLGTWTGIAVLAAGLTLDALGALWMNSLVRRATAQ